MLLAEVFGVKSLGLSVSPQGNISREFQRAPISALYLLYNFFPFSSIVFSYFSGFLFWLQTATMEILSPRLPVKHLLPLCYWEDSRNVVCFSRGKSHPWKWVFILVLPTLCPGAEIMSWRPGWRQLLLGFHWSPVGEELSSFHLGTVWAIMTLQHHHKMKSI